MRTMSPFLTGGQKRLSRNTNNLWTPAGGSGKLLHLECGKATFFWQKPRRRSVATTECFRCFFRAQIDHMNTWQLAFWRCQEQIFKTHSWASGNAIFWKKNTRRLPRKKQQKSTNVTQTRPEQPQLQLVVVHRESSDLFALLTTPRPPTTPPKRSRTLQHSPSLFPALPRPSARLLLTTNETMFKEISASRFWLRWWRKGGSLHHPQGRS